MIFMLKYFKIPQIQFLSSNSLRTVFSQGRNASKAAFRPSWDNETLTETHASKIPVDLILTGA